MVVNERRGAGIKHYNDYKTFIEYSNDGRWIFKYVNIEEYKPEKKRKVLIVFNDMIADMLCNEKLEQKVIDQFIRGKKLKSSLAFIT